MVGKIVNGYTGSRKYELAGIVHYGSGIVPCSCGLLLFYEGSPKGTMYEHTSPIVSWKEHKATVPGYGTVEISIY